MTLTLEAAKTVAGVAANATSVTYTILGDEVGVSDSFKVLAQGQLPAAAGTLYTTPGATATIVKTILLINTAGTAQAVTMYLGGTAAANSIGSFNIPTGGSATWNGVWNLRDANGASLTTSTTTLTGDVTGTGTGSVPTTLATVATPGTTGDASHTAQVTLDAKGRTTTATAVAIVIPESAVTNLVTDLAGKQPTGNYLTALTGDVAASGPGSAAATLATVNGAPGTKGSASAVPVFVVNGKGLVTSETDTAIQITESQVTNLTTDLAGKQPTGNYVTALTGDVSATGPGSVAATLATVNANVGAFGSATAVAAFTVNGKGLTTAASAVPIQIAESQVTNLVTDLGAKAVSTRLINTTSPLTGGGDLSADRTIAIPAATPSAGGYMSANDKKKLNLHIYDVVADYGADPTGSTDSTTAINNAIAAASVAGFAGAQGAGIVWFPGGRYKTSSTIVVTAHNIKLWGPGGGSSLDFGAYYLGMGAALVPNAAFKALQVLPVQTNGVSGVTNTGFEIRGLGVDCFSANGTIALQLISCANFNVDDFFSINATDTALDFNTLPAALLTVAATWPLSAATLTVNSTAASGSGPAFAANTNTAGSVVVKDGTGTPRLVTYTGGSATTFTGCSSAGAGTGTTAIGGGVQILPGAQDTTRGRVGMVNVRALDGGAAAGIGIRMNGDGAGLANTNLINLVGPIKIAHLNGAAIKDINSDSNYYDVVVINRAGGGTGLGAEIGAAPTSVGASRNNVFNHVSFGAGGLTLRGTPTAAFPSGPTYVHDLQLANGEALPTVEAGATLYWQPNGCFRPGILGTPATAAQAAITAATTAVTGTVFAVPPQGLAVGTTLKWTICYLQTTTAVATNGVTIRYGATGTAADAAVATWTPTSTAATGTQAKLEIYFTIVSNGGAGTFYTRLEVVNQTALGLFGSVSYNTVTPTSTTAIDTTAPSSAVRFLSVAMTAAASNTLTPQLAYVECLKSANP